MTTLPSTSFGAPLPPDLPPSAPAPPTPSIDELYRWAEHDAAPFLQKLSLPEAGHSITAWTDALPQARTSAQLHAVVEAVLGDGPSALGALHEFLKAAAAQYEHHQEPVLAASVRSAAQTLTALGDTLAWADEAHLRSAYGAVLPRTTTPQRHLPASVPLTAHATNRRTR
ncbi:hypothetical protein ACQPZG_31735 [Streptomyces sp. CA-294286]|uniref:hypothetical protein n=1 Tax=Streptomyces sp. CA-294286 TaxID=3240070 RepID=UPI003D903C71